MAQQGKAKGKRRMPTKQQVRVWRDYIETADALRSMSASRLQSAASLSAGDYQVLLALTEATSTRLRSSELAANIGWERSRLSHHLGRMEKRGLIRREECADDSRGAEVVLSDDGARAFRTGSIPHLEAVRELFIDALSPAQLVQLEELTASLRAHAGLDERPPGS